MMLAGKMGRSGYVNKEHKELDEAFEKYRAEHFGAYAEYPIEAYTYFSAGWNAKAAAGR